MGAQRDPGGLGVDHASLPRRRSRPRPLDARRSTPARALARLAPRRPGGSRDPGHRALRRGRRRGQRLPLLDARRHWRAGQSRRSCDPAGSSSPGSRSTPRSCRLAIGPATGSRSPATTRGVQPRNCRCSTAGRARNVRPTQAVTTRSASIDAKPDEK